MWRSLSDRPREEIAQFWLRATQESRPLGIYYLNMAISKNLANLATLQFFSHKNHFHELHWLLSFCFPPPPPKKKRKVPITQRRPVIKVATFILFWKSYKSNNKYLKLNFSSPQHVLKRIWRLLFCFSGHKSFFLATLGHFFTKVLFVSRIGFSFIVKWW